MGTKVKDSKKPITIHVKENHCIKGQRGAKNYCIIALAAKEQMGDFFEGVKIGLRYTTFTLAGGNKVRCSTPYQTSEALKVYDTGGRKLKPGNYVFNRPRKSESVEYQRKMSKKYHAPGYVKTRTNKKCKRRAISRKVIYSKFEPSKG